jgi:hypothetical protein
VTERQDRPEPDRGGESAGFGPSLLQLLRRARDIYQGIYVAPYRSTIHRQYLHQRDLFFLMAFADLLGIPNPMTFYTLELYPELIEQFHEWHRRMGMPHAPEDGFRCC